MAGPPFLRLHSSAWIVRTTHAEAAHFTGLTIHSHKGHLWKRKVIDMLPCGIGSELRYVDIWEPVSPEVRHMLDDLSHCLLYRQEGYIPSNYVTEAEDSIEMYEWVCLCLNVQLSRSNIREYIIFYAFNKIFLDFKIHTKTSANWIKWCQHPKFVSMTNLHSKHPLLMRIGKSPCTQTQKNHIQNKLLTTWWKTTGRWKGPNFHHCPLSPDHGLSLSVLVPHLFPETPTVCFCPLFPIPMGLQCQPGFGKGTLCAAHWKDTQGIVWEQWLNS